LIGGNNQQPLQQPAKLGPIAHLASAAEAGSLVCFVTNPIWVAKTRLQLQRQQMLKAATAVTKTPPMPLRGKNVVPNTVGGTPLSGYTGFLECLVKTAQAEGIAGLYRGLVPSLFLVSHGAIQFAVYEELKSATPRLRDFLRPLGVCVDEKKDHALSSVEITACGALSKLAASVATYPSQVVRSRLQQRMDVRAVKYKGILDVMRTTLKREGVSGFYKGLVPNVLRVMPQSALTFLVYETIMRHLEMHP
jgi:solute carrier family 25 (mitochondrial folate transporter), member 32